MLNKSIMSLIFLSALIFQGCSSDSSSEKQVTQVDEANSMIAKSQNEYILTSTDTKQYVVKKEANGFVLEGAEGKVLIIDIFATWCPPCKAAASHLSSLQEKYKDDLVILGVTIEDDIPNEKLEDFKKQYNANYVLVNSTVNRRLVNDVAAALEVGDRFPIPLMALYKDGKLINHYVGAVEEEFIASDIKKAMGI